MRLRHNELQRLDRLPPNWVLTTLGSFLPLTYGKALKRELRDESGTVPVYGSSGQVGLHATALTKAPALIVGRKGSVGSVYRSTVPCWPIDTVYFCEERADVDAKYAEYLLRGLNLSRLDKSTAVPGLSRDDYNTVEVAVAPLDEQKRIVAEIEKQFSRLDEAVANLNRVKANLKRYKAAVLKAAVEGRLVETDAAFARREGSTYENGQRLLDRILETRRSTRSAERTYREPLAPEPFGGYELPPGWTWSSLSQLTSKITSGSRDWSQYYGKGSSVFLLAQNVRPLVPDFAVTQLVDPPLTDPSCERSRVATGDLLTTIVGANTGQVCLLPDIAHTAYVCQSVALLRPVLAETAPYLNYWLNSAEHGQRYFKTCQYGQGRPHLSFEQLCATPVALPPLSEQHRIVMEVDQRLSIADQFLAQMPARAARTDRLRQSILSRAFAGTLLSYETAHRQIGLHSERQS